MDEDGVQNNLELQSYSLNNGKLFENKSMGLKFNSGKYYKNNIEVTKEKFQIFYKKYYSADDVKEILGDQLSYFEYVNTDYLELSIGDTEQLDVIGSTKETWKSSDESIATINEQGFVTAVALGDVTVMAETSGDLHITYVKVLSEEAKNAPILSKDVILDEFQFIIPREWPAKVINNEKKIYTYPKSEQDNATGSTSNTYGYSDSITCITKREFTESIQDFESLKNNFSQMYLKVSIEYFLGRSVLGFEYISKTENEIEINNHKFCQLTYLFNYQRIDGTTASGTFNIYAAIYGDHFLTIEECEYGNGPKSKTAMNYLLSSIQYNKE